MGYTTRKHRGGETRHFWPDDTDKEFYISNSATMEEIFERCREKWPDASCPLGFSIGNIRIEAQFLHTDCLGYDSMDWGDYTHFLCITKGD